MLMRSVRLVVDTGIHYKRWSREQAIQYMVQNTVMQESEGRSRAAPSSTSPLHLLTALVGVWWRSCDGDRALLCVARSGVRLLCRLPAHFGSARQSQGRSRRPVRHQSVSRRYLDPIHLTRLLIVAFVMWTCVAVLLAGSLPLTVLEQVVRARDLSFFLFLATESLP